MDLKKRLVRKRNTSLHAAAFVKEVMCNLLYKGSIIRKGVITLFGDQNGGGGSKNRTINISPRPFDRFV